MSTAPNLPRVADNDRDEITVTLNGKELRGWSYRDEAERRVKMLAAREFVEGWYVGSKASVAPDMLEALKAIGAPDEVDLVAVPDPVIRGMLYAAIRVAQDVIEKAEASDV